MVKTINCGGATLVYGFHISIECAEGLHFSAFHCAHNQCPPGRYYLERSNSAKLTLKRAKELFPMEVLYYYNNKACAKPECGVYTVGAS